MKDNSIKLQRLIEELLDYQRALHAAAALEPSVSLPNRGARSRAIARARGAGEGLRVAIDAEAATLRAIPTAASSSTT